MLRRWVDDHDMDVMAGFEAYSQRLWQIMSEELEDGDIKRHHMRLYAELLRSLVPDMPDAQLSRISQQASWSHGRVDLAICCLANDDIAIPSESISRAAWIQPALRSNNAGLVESYGRKSRACA